jgi:hypothetical protein
MPEQFPVGAHVIYHGKSYSFPGEVTMRDDTGVVVKAFGDIEGNYTGMKHIYSDGVLQPYVFGDGSAHHCPPLVIFADDNPIAKMRQWVRLYGERPAVKSARGMATVAKLLDELEALEAKATAWEEREALQVRLDRQNALADEASKASMAATRTVECPECRGTGTTGDDFFKRPVRCAGCGGTGVVPILGTANPKPLTAPDTRIACDECGGSGWVGHGMGGDSCAGCNGRGYH